MHKKEGNKRGQILMENLVFIILNFVFLTIMIVFLYTKMSSAAVLEEQYAKQIALLIDSAKPGMLIKLDMEDAIKKAEDNGISSDKIVSINENIVNVNLRDKGGYSYSFFNDLTLQVYPILENGEDKDKWIVKMMGGSE